MYYTNKQARTPRFYEGANNVRYAEETIPVFARWFGSWQVSVQRLAFSSPELAHRYDRAAPGWGRTLDRLGYPGAYETLLRSVLSEEALEVVGARPRVHLEHRRPRRRRTPPGPRRLCPRRLRRRPRSAARRRSGGDGGAAPRLGRGDRGRPRHGDLHRNGRLPLLRRAPAKERRLASNRDRERARFGVNRLASSGTSSPHRHPRRWGNRRPCSSTRSI